MKVANSRWLPLYYGFQYDATLLWYRVVSDEAIEILRQEKTEWTPDFPFENYPWEFPMREVAITEPRPVTEILHDPEWVEEWEEWCAETKKPPDHNDLIALEAGLLHGSPAPRCINESCEKDRMNIFAVIDDYAEGFSFWYNRAPHEDVKIVFAICPRCSLIHATNQLI